MDWHYVLWHQGSNSEFVRAAGCPVGPYFWEVAGLNFNHMWLTYSKFHLELILQPPLWSCLKYKVGLTSFLFNPLNPVAARLLRSWVRIPPGAWIFVCCECRVLSGRGLCDELITHPEESYRLWCVVV